MPDDTAALIALADATGLFGANQLEELGSMLSDYFGGNSDSNRLWITDDDNGAVGVAYCEMERMTDGTWNLQLIVIRPDRQGQGRGATLLGYVEQTLTARGGRVLLVETRGYRTSSARERSIASAVMTKKRGYATSIKRAMTRSFGCNAKKVGLNWIKFSSQNRVAKS